MKVNKPAAWMLVGCLILCVPSCSWAPPGKGWKAKAGYRAAVPVIAALEKFHQEQGRYPADLSALVPAYLPNTRELRVRGKSEPVYSPHRDLSAHQQEYDRFNEFGYQRDGDAYSLSFSYTGPGMNRCAYDPLTKTWHARGYY